MIKMLYLHILQADSTENWNAFCKLIVLDNYKISKKSKKSVLSLLKILPVALGILLSVYYTSVKVIEKQ